MPYAGLSQGFEEYVILCLECRPVPIHIGGSETEVVEAVVAFGLRLLYAYAPLAESRAALVDDQALPERPGQA